MKYTVIENQKKYDTVVYKYPVESFSRKTQLVVNPGEEALFVKNGVIVSTLAPGLYYFDTDHTAVQKVLRSIFAGKTSEYHCSIYFVNKTHKMEMFWGTDSPMRLRDNIYKFSISVRARGTYSIQIENSELFFSKMVGKDSDSITFDSIKENFRSVFVTKIKSQLAQHMTAMQASIMDMAATLDDNSSILLEKLRPVFAEYGIKLVAFYIVDISIPEDDPNYEKINAAYADSAVRNIQGYTWEQEQNSRLMRDIANNPAPSPGLSSGLMAAANANANSIARGLSQGNAPQAVFCTMCGAQNPAGAKFCFKCGKALATTLSCPKCGSQLPTGAAFCPNCGCNIGG